MPTISGSLNLVTDRPVDSISEVWVRARETRGQGDGLVLGVNDRVPVSDGVVEFTALPGAAVLVLLHNGMPIETHPMLITDEPEQSLRAVVQTVQIAGAAEQQILEQLAAEVAADAARAGRYSVEAAAARDDAQAAATTASSAARTEVARVVDGAPEDLDTIREIAEYAQANRDITDQLNQAIGNKANKGHTHTTSEVTGLQAALDNRSESLLFSGRNATSFNPSFNQGIWGVSSARIYPPAGNWLVEIFGTADGNVRFPSTDTAPIGVLDAQFRWAGVLEVSTGDFLYLSAGNSTNDLYVVRLSPLGT